MGKDGCDVVERGRGEVRPTRERGQLIFDFFTEGERRRNRLRSGIAVGADCRGTMLTLTLTSPRTLPMASVVTQDCTPEHKFFHDISSIACEYSDLLILRISTQAPLRNGLIQ